MTTIGNTFNSIHIHTCQGPPLGQAVPTCSQGCRDTDLEIFETVTGTSHLSSSHGARYIPLTCPAATPTVFVSTVLSVTIRSGSVVSSVCAHRALPGALYTIHYYMV